MTKKYYVDPGAYFTINGRVPPFELTKHDYDQLKALVKEAKKTDNWDGVEEALREMQRDSWFDDLSDVELEFLAEPTFTTEK